MDIFTDTNNVFERAFQREMKREVRRTIAAVTIQRWWREKHDDKISVVATDNDTDETSIEDEPLTWYEFFSSIMSQFFKVFETFF